MMGFGGTDAAIKLKRRGRLNPSYRPRSYSAAVRLPTP
jgi:hypothetical protein